MPHWKSYLRNDTLDWLLEDNNPSVRYFTLIDLIDKKLPSAEVKAARARIMTEGPVPMILSKQKPEGYWEDSSSYYYPKFKSAVWTLGILAELAADANDERIRQACEFILVHAQHRASGAFSYKGDRETGGRRNVIPCLTGNVLFCMIRFGYLEDARVQKGIEWIVKYKRFDDGEKKAPTGWPYNAGHKKGEGCWGTHTCHLGVVGCLKALAEIPEKWRSVDVKSVIEQASEYMLKHRIYKRSHNLAQIGNPRWIKAGFPLTYDFLGVLSLLSKLGYRDDRMQDAIDLLLTKQNQNGRWVLEESWNGRFQTDIEIKGKESKWITLTALRSLKNFYS